MDLLIRHGPKSHANTDLWAEFRFDAALTEDGMLVTREKMRSLISEVGVPSVVRTSPYLRTRQTADIILSLCPVSPVLEVDANLSEYLGHQRGNFAGCFRSETLQYSPPQNESMVEFKTRVSNYLNSNVGSEGVTFHVTHGLFLHVAAELEGQQLPSGIASLASHYRLRNYRPANAGKYRGCARK